MQAARRACSLEEGHGAKYYSVSLGLEGHSAKYYSVSLDTYAHGYACIHLELLLCFTTPPLLLSLATKFGRMLTYLINTLLDVVLACTACQNA